MDAARGFALLCVIAGHYLSGRYRRIIFSFHMPLLFIITGYLSYDPFDIMQFAKKRMKRVLLPYIIPLLVVWMAIHFGNAKALLDILLGMLNSTSYYTVEQGVGPAWFYCAYVVSSIVFALILHHCSCKRWALAISAILISAIGYAISRYIELPWQIDNAFVVVFFLWQDIYARNTEKKSTEEQMDTWFSVY